MAYALVPAVSSALTSFDNEPNVNQKYKTNKTLSFSNDLENMWTPYLDTTNAFKASVKKESAPTQGNREKQLGNIKEFWIILIKV